MEFKPYKSISKYSLEKFKKGTAIVDFLTDWKTPCYIYSPEKEIIAVNNGVDTYAETSNETHIFENRMKNNFMIPYLTEQKIIFKGDIPVSMHIEKQLMQPFFSTFYFEGTTRDIIEEFIKKGYEIILLNKNMSLFLDASDKNRQAINKLEEEARTFYKSCVGLKNK